MKVNRENLFRFLAEHELSRTQLAKMAGLTPACVGNLLSGKTSTMTPATAGKLAKALGIDVTDICIFDF